MAPGVTEKFIVRINKDSKGTLKLPAQGVETGQTEVRKMGRVWGYTGRGSSQVPQIVHNGP